MFTINLSEICELGSFAPRIVQLHRELPRHILNSFQIGSVPEKLSLYLRRKCHNAKTQLHLAQLIFQYDLLPFSMASAVPTGTPEEPPFRSSSFPSCPSCSKLEPPVLRLSSRFVNSTERTTFYLICKILLAQARFLVFVGLASVIKLQLRNAIFCLQSHDQAKKKECFPYWPFVFR